MIVMAFDVGSIFAYILGLFLVYVCCWLFLKPLKWLFRLMISCLIGGVVVVGLNYALAFFDLHIAVNPLTALFTGVLGLPGIIMTFIMQTIL